MAEFAAMAFLTSPAYHMAPFAHSRESAPVQPRLYFGRLDFDVNIGKAGTFNGSDIPSDESFNLSKLLMLLT